MKATNRPDTGVNARGRALQQATMVTTLLKRRESSFVWYFRYIKPRICDSGAEFGLAKLHFTARGRIPKYINLPREHRDCARLYPPIDSFLRIMRKLHASLSLVLVLYQRQMHKYPDRIPITLRIFAKQLMLMPCNVLMNVSS